MSFTKMFWKQFVLAPQGSVAYHVRGYPLVEHMRVAVEAGELGELRVVHGRYVCVARKPKCQDCVVADLCPSRDLFLGM